MVQTAVGKRTARRESRYRVSTEAYASEPPVENHVGVTVGRCRKWMPRHSSHACRYHPPPFCRCHCAAVSNCSSPAALTPVCDSEVLLAVPHPNHLLPRSLTPRGPRCYFTDLVRPVQGLLRCGHSNVRLRLPACSVAGVIQCELCLATATLAAVFSIAQSVANL